jgi:hypothetical protein
VKILTERIKKNKMFTLFSRKASASALAPAKSISLPARLSLLSVYERIVKI